MEAPFLSSRYLAAFLAIALLGASGDAFAPVRPVTDDYFGTKIVDPYRYMEQKDPAYVAWRDKQAAVTLELLAKIRKAENFDAAAPAKSQPKIEYLTLAAGHAFYLKEAGPLDELVDRDLAAGTERTIVTNATYDTAAARAHLGALAVTTDAKTLAIHVYVGDSIASDVHVLRVADGSDVEPPLHDTIYDYLGFTSDGKQLLYAKSAKPVTSIAMPDVAYDYIHRIGTAQSADTVIFGNGVSPLVDVPPRAFAFVDVSAGTQAVAEVRDVAVGGSRFYAAPVDTLGKPGTPWRLLGTPSSHFTDYAVHGTTIDFASNAGAPNYKVVRGSLTGPFEPHVILPPSQSVVVSGTLDGIPKAGIFSLNAAADADYVQLLDRGINRMVRIPYEGNQKPEPVPLPIAGSILQVTVDPSAPGALLDLSSWTQQGDIYAFEPKRGVAVALGFRKAPGYPRRVAEEIGAKAADGTSIPLSVVHRAGIALDGSHPLILRVAGAYGFSFTPDYDQVPEGWLERGGIYAVAHVRGGGELGEAWHRAALGSQKSRSWTDLIACAQKLISLGYTSPKKLDLYGTIQSYLGGIASSIAIGRAIEERPDLFAAAVVDAPSFDMLRSERTPLGRQSTSEFGSVATRPGFEALLAMSPYAHVKPGVQYPTVLIRSLARIGLGDNWEAAKMVARLQAAEGRTDRAYLDVLGDASVDKRGRDALRDDAFAFFLYEDGAH